jgi:serine phosphatase RsbU (regulator of sigma subunit)
MDHEHLLREKVILLMARERELTALRKKLERASAWLTVAYGLPEMASALLPEPEIYERFSRSLIHALQLQAVCLYELADDGRLVGILEMGRPKRGGADRTTGEQLVRGQVVGMCNEPKTEAERGLGTMVGLHRFLWYRLDQLQRPSLLVVAGYDAERALFYAPFSDEDTAHFASLGHHLQILLGNKALISELETDKRALTEFNQKLEKRVEERTEEVNEYNRELARTLGSLREKEQRITDDLLQARAFQQSILPALPVSGEIAFQAFFRPLELVGGDIYDICRLSDGRFRVFMADATGHGVQASMRTVVLKSEYDRLKHALVAPGTLLQDFSRNVVTLYPESEMLCTGCCLDVTPTGGGAIVHYANAAHPPLLHLIDGEVRQIYSDGPFLGLAQEIDVPTTTFTLDVGHRLLVYTDGLCDHTRPDGSSFDLARAMIGGQGAPLGAFLEHVLRSLDDFREGRENVDDLTVVALEVLGADS